MSGPPWPPGPQPGSNQIGSFQIGISPIGDISPFNFWTTVQSEYANSPIITQLMSNFAQYLDQTANFDAFFDNMFNIDTANGYGLDCWGRIVGVSRIVQLPSGTKFFGFNEAGDPNFGGTAPFFSGTQATTNFALIDTQFRTLIFAKALTNISDGSIPSINQILLNLFPNRGNCYVADLGNMKMQYVFNFTLSPVEIAIVETSGVLPKPVGVAATFVYPGSP